jgi:hypothetical protein
MSKDFYNKEVLPNSESSEASFEAKDSQEEIKNPEQKEYQQPNLQVTAQDAKLADVPDESIEVNAASIQLLSAKGKITELLQIAQKKGVEYAVKVAMKMDDAYLVDSLHDALAKDEHYKDFVK